MKTGEAQATSADCSSEEQLALETEQAARIAHEVNRAYCKATGDDSQPSWEDAPEWQKQSAIAGVQLITTNPSTTPEQSHAAWSAQKLADGWKYGPSKDPENKLHHCLVPYAELPLEQRVKDYLFGAAVRAFYGIAQ